MKEAIDFIEEKRKQVSDRLQKLLNQGEISTEFYEKSIELSEQLRRTLAIAFIKGEKLIKTGIIKDISDFFKLERKPIGREQAFRKMREQIKGPFGSKNVYVQHKAAEASKLSERYEFPQDLGVSDLYKRLSGKYLPSSAREETFLHFTHMRMVARAIYERVRQEIAYVSDPPDDWFKPALHTLIVKGGDCDDLAILLCSLWRSIGFKTYLGFLPHHVFPGIKLAWLSPKPIKKDELPTKMKEFFQKEYPGEDIYLIKEVRVPTDWLIFFPFPIKVGEVDRSFDVFDLAFMGREFKKKISALTSELERMPEEVREKAEREYKKKVKDMIDKFSTLLSAETFQIEPKELRRLLEEE